ncbi:MAG: hypothetical protein WBM44_16705 [Waterburya sp.]
MSTKKDKVYLQIIAETNTPLAQVLNKLKESSVVKSAEAAQALLNYFLPLVYLEKNTLTKEEQWNLMKSLTGLEQQLNLYKHFYQQTQGLNVEAVPTATSDLTANLPGNSLSDQIQDNENNDDDDFNDCGI